MGLPICRPCGLVEIKYGFFLITFALHSARQGGIWVTLSYNIQYYAALTGLLYVSALARGVSDVSPLRAG